MATKLLTANQAAKEIGKSPQSLRRYADTGEIPALKMGRDWFFDLADLKKFTPQPRGPKPKKRKRVVGRR